MGRLPLPDDLKHGDADMGVGVWLDDPEQARQEAPGATWEPRLTLAGPAVLHARSQSLTSQRSSSLSSVGWSLSRRPLLNVRGR